MNGVTPTEDYIRAEHDNIPGDEFMASVRLRGVCAKVADKDILEKARLIRKLIGREYKIIIEKNHICVEGNIQDYKIRKKIEGILAS